MFNLIVPYITAAFVSFGFTVMTITSDGLAHPHAIRWAVGVTIIVLVLMELGDEQIPFTTRTQK